MPTLFQLEAAAKERLQRRQMLAAEPSSATLADVYQAIIETHDAITQLSNRLNKVEQVLKIKGTS